MVERNLKFFVSFIFLFILTLPSMAQQVKVVAPQVVSIDEHFALRYVIENADVDDIQLPALKDFTRLSGPNPAHSQSYSFVNGKSSSTRSVTYTYILQPKDKGEFTIPEASLRIEGKTVRAKSVTIKVVESSQNGSGNANVRQRARRQRSVVQLREITDSDLFVKVKPSRTHIYEQEAVVLTYTVYSKLGVGLSQIMLAKTPDFKNLLAHEFPVSENDVRVEEINGEVFKVTDCLKYVVFPQQSGDITVTPLIFECQVVQQNPEMNEIDAFFNGGMVSKILKRSTQPLKLKVEELPDSKPNEYVGGVGNFHFSAELTTPKLRANEMGNIRIEVSGHGNMKLLLPPTIEFPADFDSYEVKITEELQLEANGHCGKVIYDYNFVPYNVGNYTLPSIKMAYFDPEAKAYRTVEMNLPTLTVKAGVQSSVGASRNVDIADSDIRTIRLGTVKMKQCEEITQWGNFWFWLIHILMLIVTFGVIAAGRRWMANHADLTSRLRRRAGKAATKRLKNVKAVLDGRSKADFYQELHAALNAYLVEKFGLSKASLNKTEIRDCLLQAGLTSDCVERFIKLLEECEYARYAPVKDVSQNQSVYDEACKLINIIEQ